MKVELNPLVLAKSHHPVDSLFPGSKAPVVGALGIGELLIQATDKNLVHIYSKIDGAEEYTKKAYDDRQGKIVNKPSEAEAIDRISFYGSEEKIAFSAEDNAAWYADKNEGFTGYEVNLNHR